MSRHVLVVYMQHADAHALEERERYLCTCKDRNLGQEMLGETGHSWHLSASPRRNGRQSDSLLPQHFYGDQ
jgi:hypothetical protein